MPLVMMPVVGIAVAAVASVAATTTAVGNANMERLGKLPHEIYP